MDEKRIGLKIKILANLISRSLNEACFNKDVCNMTGPQGLVLAYLYKHQDKDVFQKDIETEFNVRRSSATGLLKCLESNGFIMRESVKHDARLKKITLTQKAHDYQLILEKNIDQIEAVLTTNLSDEEITDLVRLLDKVKKNVE